MIPRIAITVGEPAGIGPDLCVEIAQKAFDAELVVIADPDVLSERAQSLGLSLSIESYHSALVPQRHRPGVIKVLPLSVRNKVRCGHLDVANAPYVLDTLHRAIDGCMSGEFAAMVTGPVQKSVINDAGVAFTGHTELLADKTATNKVVMMLATEGLRVALVTTHLPLRAICDAITADNVENTLRIVHQSMCDDFSITDPRILVCGLNPHAGENGHLGTEEQDIIEPVMDRLRQEGFKLEGPLPADTAFVPHHLDGCDVVVAMYHDQGLPVLKYRGFGEAVNITLGLPFIRTSVDHGTALSLAGSGKAGTGSLEFAIEQALLIHNNQMALSDAQRAAS